MERKRQHTSKTIVANFRYYTAVKPGSFARFLINAIMPESIYAIGHTDDRKDILIGAYREEAIP